jgi:diacylglycerol kinase
MSNPALRESKAAVSQNGFSARKTTPDARSEPRRSRSHWRQRLVEAERGFSYSFRADSALYRHIFLDSLLLAICGVLGLSAAQWAMVAIGMTVMLSSELFAQALQIVASQLPERLRKQTASLAAAAKLLAILGSTSAIGIVLAIRLRELFG